MSSRYFATHPAPPADPTPAAPDGGAVNERACTACGTSMADCQRGIWAEESENEVDPRCCPECRHETDFRGPCLHGAEACEECAFWRGRGSALREMESEIVAFKALPFGWKAALVGTVQRLMRAHPFVARLAPEGKTGG